MHVFAQHRLATLQKSKTVYGSSKSRTEVDALHRILMCGKGILQVERLAYEITKKEAR